MNKDTLAFKVRFPSRELLDAIEQLCKAENPEDNISMNKMILKVIRIGVEAERKKKDMSRGNLRKQA